MTLTAYKLVANHSQAITLLGSSSTSLNNNYIALRFVYEHYTIIYLMLPNKFLLSLMPGRSAWKGHLLADRPKLFVSQRHLTVGPPKPPAENNPNGSRKPTTEEFKEETRSAAHQVKEAAKGAAHAGNNIVQEVQEVASDLGHRVMEKGKQAVQTTKEMFTGKGDKPLNKTNPPST